MKTRRPTGANTVSTLTSMQYVSRPFRTLFSQLVIVGRQSLFVATWDMDWSRLGTGKIDSSTGTEIL